MSDFTEEQAVEFAGKASEKVIEVTKKQYLDFRLIKDVKPTVFETKLGGLPYLPDDAEIPVDKKGKQMGLVMQINCKDLEPLKDFPHVGILQFWVTTDYMHDEAKVTYFNEIDETVTYEMAEKRIEKFDEDFPVEKECKVEFELKTGSISNDDSRLQALFCKYYGELSGDFIQDPEDAGDGDYGEAIYSEFEYLKDQMCTFYLSNINGYEQFAQLAEYDKYEPNEKIVSDDDENAAVLLLQLGWHKGIMMWGDCGFARYYISKKNLKNCNFNKVGFSWECS